MNGRLIVNTHEIGLRPGEPSLIAGSPTQIVQKLCNYCHILRDDDELEIHYRHVLETLGAGWQALGQASADRKVAAGTTRMPFSMKSWPPSRVT